MTYKEYVISNYLNRFDVEGYAEDVKALDLSLSNPSRDYDVDHLAAVYGQGVNTIIADNYRLNR